MKTVINYIILFLIFTCCTIKNTDDISVMSFNIRFDNPEDGSNNWKYRQPIIKAYLDSVMPDIIATQEAMDNQIEDIKHMLPHYKFIGYSLEQGQRWGEQCHIFFKEKDFILKSHSQFRLADNPDIKGDIGWDAVLHRSVIWAELLHKKSGTTIFFFNTHFDHVGKQAKRESVKVITRKIKEIAGNNPFIVTGDFNTIKNSDIYAEMTTTFKNEVNAEDAGNRYAESEPHSTFNAFRISTKPHVIDYIFVGDTFEINSYRVDKVKNDSIFISDHWPLLVKLKLKK